MDLRGKERNVVVVVVARRRRYGASERGRAKLASRAPTARLVLYYTVTLVPKRASKAMYDRLRLCTMTGIVKFNPLIMTPFFIEISEVHDI